MKIMKKTLLAAGVAGLMAVPFSSAHAWWGGGPGYGGSDWGPFDGDGWGDLEIEQFACDQPVNYVRNRRDCNDTLPSVNPDGVEVCNERDDDCDGSIDEELGCEKDPAGAVVNEEGCGGCQSGERASAWLPWVVTDWLARR